MSADNVDEQEQDDGRRRLLLLVFLLLIAISGAGIGTMVFGGNGGDGSTPATATPPTGSAAPSVDISLIADGEVRFLQAADVTPGDRGRKSIVLVNDGRNRGRLYLANATVADNENGIVTPERAVDETTDTGELSGTLLVWLSVEYPNGTTKSLFGSADDPKPLSKLESQERSGGGVLDVGDRAILVLEWQLPDGAGNELQSDGVEFTVTFELRASESALGA